MRHILLQKAIQMPYAPDLKDANLALKNGCPQQKY